MDDALRKYMSELGRRGGRSKSQKKLDAVRKTLKKANAKRLRRRLPHGGDTTK